MADIRDRIKALEAREGALRSLMFSDPSARTGNHVVVEIEEVQTTRLDTKELKANYPDITAQFEFRVPVKRVVLRAVSEDGEIVSRRRQP